MKTAYASRYIESSITSSVLTTDQLLGGVVLMGNSPRPYLRTNSVRSYSDWVSIDRFAIVTLLWRKK